MLNPIHHPTPSTHGPKSTSQDLVAAARAFEAMVISQMLQASGINKPPDGFGGGTGEEQFASFLTDTQTHAVVRNGGFGLAERLIRALAPHGAT